MTIVRRLLAAFVLEAAVTGPSIVTVTRPCPGCGKDTTWTGRHHPNGGTTYDGWCDRCDGTWRAQLERRKASA